MDPSDANWWWGGVGYTPNQQDANTQEGQHERNMIGDYFRNTGQANGFNTANYDAGAVQPWQQKQMALANQLGAVASGQQKGAGELAVDRQVQQAQAAQHAAAASARGANSSIAGLAAARNTANVGIAGAGQAQQAALQDQANARSALQQTLQSGQQGGLTMAAAQLQAQGMNQQQTMQLLSAQMGIDQSELQARLQQEAIAAGTYQKGNFGPAASAAGSAIAALA